MAITRKCDLCSKGEEVVGFIQHYECIPKRRIGTAPFIARGVRSMDLCGECVGELTIAFSEARPETTGWRGPVGDRRDATEVPAPILTGIDPGSPEGDRTAVIVRGAPRKGKSLISARSLPPGTIAVMTDKGTRYPYQQRRPNRCLSCYKRSGTRCYMDIGHVGEHRASNGQHWLDVDGVEYVPVPRRRRKTA